MLSLLYELVARLAILICVGCFTVAGVMVFQDIERKFDERFESWEERR